MRASDCGGILVLKRESQREREKVSGDTFKGAYTMCTSFGELLQKLVGWFIWLL